MLKTLGLTFFCVSTLVLNTSFAEITVVEDKHVEVSAGASTSDKPGFGKGVTAGAAVQTDKLQLKIKDYNDTTVLQFQPRLEGSVQIDPSSGGVQKADANLTFFKAYNVSRFAYDPGNPFKYGYMGGAMPKIRYTKDNVKQISELPSVEVFRVGVLSSGFDAQGVTHLCGLMAPAWILGPNEIGVTKLGTQSPYGVSLRWNFDAFCSVRLGKAGQLNVAAGVEAGVAYGRAPNAKDGDDIGSFGKVYGDFGLKNIAGSPISAGVNYTHSRISPSGESGIVVNEATANAKVAW